MQRFFSPKPLDIDMEITDTKIIHQMSHVLRLAPNNQVIFFDGDGSETTYTIKNISRKSIILRGTHREFPEQREPTRSIHLYQALPNKHEKIEWIIQKSVEIGVKSITFFRADRSQKLIVSSAKIQRYTTIATEALEQCGGLVPTQLHFHDTHPLISPPSQDMQHIVLHPQGNATTFSDITNLPTTHFGIWIGCEGGWSATEIEKMNSYNMISVRFSQRILRTETAGITIAFGIIHA